LEKKRDKEKRIFIELGKNVQFMKKALEVTKKGETHHCIWGRIE
jgi:hypothetical protein